MIWSWLIAIVAVEAIVEIATTSQLLNVPRAYILAKNNFFSELIACGWCASVWIAAAFGWALPGEPTGILTIDIILKTFALQRLANYLHEMRANWLTPQLTVQHRKLKEEE